MADPESQNAQAYARSEETIAFLRQIALRPDDDLPRLIYADWLDDHGNEQQASFIRMQVERGKLQDRLDCEPWLKNGAEWRATQVNPISHYRPLDNLPHADCTPAWVELDHKRGFAENLTITLTPGDASNIDQLCKYITDCLCSDASTVTSMTINGQDGCDSDDLRRILEIPGIDKLTKLSVNAAAFGRDEAVSVIGSAARLSNLKHLDLSYSNLSARAVEYLTESSCLGALEVLNLSNNGIGRQGCQALASPNSRLAKLVRVNVDNNRIGDAGMGELLRGESLKSLVELSVRDNGISYSVFRGMPPRQWVSLDLSNNTEFRNEGVNFLNMPEIQRLRLDRCGIGKAGAEDLARMPQYRNLQSLSINNNAIKDDGAAAIVNSVALTALSSLSMTNCFIGNSGMDLIKSGTPTGMMMLSLADNIFDDDGLGALMQNTRFPELKALVITGNDGLVTHQGIVGIARSQSVPDEAKIACLSNLGYGRLLDVMMSSTPTASIQL